MSSISFHDTQLISFKDADPAGILFFSRVYDIAHICLENFTIQSGLGWKFWFSNPDFAAPLIHSEAVYKSPILAGLPCEIEMRLAQISDHSLTFEFDISQRGQHTCKVKTSHVFISKSERTKIKIPEQILKVVNSIYN